MLLRRLSIILEQNVADYSKPKRGLEQYRTPPEIALTIAYRLLSYNCRFYIDLGTGTGMLAYASSLLTRGYTLGIDIDSDSLLDAKRSSLYASLVIDFVQADINNLPLRPCRAKCCIVQNPPFGIYKRGYDSLFVKAAASIEPQLIISLHHAKTSLEYLLNLYNRLGYDFRVVGEESFLIPQMYERHRRRVFHTRVLIIESTLKSRQGG